MKLLIFVKIPLFHYFKLQHDKNEIQLLPNFSSYVIFWRDKLWTKKQRKIVHSSEGRNNRSFGVILHVFIYDVHITKKMKIYKILCINCEPYLISRHNLIAHTD